MTTETVEMTTTQSYPEGMSEDDVRSAEAELAPARRRGTKRTDAHRPGAIIPANYQVVAYYRLPTTDHGMPVPGWNLERVRQLRDTETFFDPNGYGMGTCGICGSHFITGAVFRHTPTGEHLHVGHNCSDKYELMSNWSEAMLEQKRQKDATAKAIQVKVNRERRQKFSAAHPGLNEAFDLAEAEFEKCKATNFQTEQPRGTSIIRDIETKLFKYMSLSQKQIDLVMKLAEAIRNPPAPKAEETKVPAPEGRQTFRGTIVAVKDHENNFGGSVLKMTIKVQAEGGVWLAWGTVPDGLGAVDGADGFTHTEPIMGKEVEVKGTLVRGRDPHFAFFKRPKAKIINQGE